MTAELQTIVSGLTCKVCNVTKSHFEFRKAKRMRFGVSNTCKDCFNAKRREAADFNRQQRELNWKTMTSKVCSRCKIDKPVNEFSKNSDRKIGITPDCKSCRRGRYKDPRKNRKDRLPAMYGVTYEDVVKTLHQQHGRCANRACGMEISLTVPMGVNKAVIDHDHETGKFRAVLCMMCNLTLGKIESDVNKVLGLIEYMDNFKKGS